MKRLKDITHSKLICINLKDLQIKQKNLVDSKKNSNYIVDNKCEQALKNLDLDSWITLCNICSKVVQLNATQNGLDLSLLKVYGWKVNNSEINKIN